MTFTPSKTPVVNNYIEALDESIKPLFVDVRETISARAPT